MLVHENSGRDDDDDDELVVLVTAAWRYAKISLWLDGVHQLKSELE